MTDTHPLSLVHPPVRRVCLSCVCLSCVCQINANKRLRQAAQERAEAQKYMTVKHAEANAESTYLQVTNYTTRWRHVTVAWLSAYVCVCVCVCVG